jgi:hypothetical protein
MTKRNQMRVLPFILWETHRLGAFLLFSMSVLSSVGVAAPPANDNCSSPVVIPNTTFPYLTPILTNINEATKLPSDPEPTCIGETRKNVWYRFTPAITGIYTFSTGSDTGTTAFDTILAVYAAPNGCASPLTEIACNDDSGAGDNRAGLGTSLTGGVNYFVVVWLSQSDDDTPGPLSLQIRVDRPQPPGNDTCATAEVIPANLGFPQKSAIRETFVASSETISPAPSCGMGYRSVWFKFTPQVTGTYILSTGNETATTVFDTMMVLYSTTSDCSALTEVACNANGEGRGSIFRTLTGGTIYYIAILDEIGSSAVVSESLVQLSVTTPTVPTVITLPVVSISSTGAVLSGTFNPNGLQSRFWFEFGPTLSYGNVSANRLLFASTAPVTTNLVVSGFSPNVTNHFRAVATNSLGRANGLDGTFVWKTAQPTLIEPERLSSGNFRFKFDANPRQLYSVDSSTNLENWTVLGLATESPAGSGHFIYTHVGAGSAPRRYYRVNAP